MPIHFEGGARFSQLRGAIARVKQDATAFWNRPAKFDFTADVSWTDYSKDAEAATAARRMWAGVEPFTRGHYVNTVSGAGEKRVRATYGDNYPRLVVLNDWYDPQNLFRLNANIKPTTTIACRLSRYRRRIHYGGRHRLETVTAAT